MNQILHPVQPFSYSRIFKAPRALVYAVHTNVEHLTKWFGPVGTKVKKFDMNFYVGGMNHYCIEVPDAIEMWGKQIYLEIVPNEKIVHVQSFSDKDAGIGHHPMSPTWPKEMLATTTFADDGAGTKVTIIWHPYNSDEIGNSTFDGARESMSGGFKGMMDNIETYLGELGKNTQVEYPSDLEMKFTRAAKAPRSLVWQAWADIKQVAKWWGPEGFSITTHEREFKAGGIWRLTMHGPDGTDYPNKIAYLEVNEPSRLIYSHGSDEDPLMFQVVTEFLAMDNNTWIETTMTFRSKDERDATGQYAIEGHSSTMRRLDSLLEQGRT